MTFVSGEGLIVWGKETKKNNYHEKKKSNPLFGNSGNVADIRCDQYKKECHIQILCLTGKMVTIITNQRKEDLHKF